MDVKEHFKAQIDGQLEGGITVYFYGIETPATEDKGYHLEIKGHRESLDTFPTNLEFSRMATDHIPVFKEI